MKIVKKLNTLLITSIVSYSIMSLDFLIMPVGNSVTDKSMRWLDILTGLIFWLGLISGTILYVFFSKECKKWYENNKGNKDIYKEKKIGLISFFSNRAALVADICLIISILLFAMLMIFTDRTSYICFISIMLLVFFFSMHCILNGKSFFVYEYVNKSLRKQ